MEVISKSINMVKIRGKLQPITNICQLIATDAELIEHKKPCLNVNKKNQI